MKKSLIDTFQNHFSAAVEKHFSAEPFFIVGVSGGPDSMALLYLLHRLKMRAMIVHVNYQKRAEDSDADQELTEQMAFAWGFECVSVRLNPEDAKGENFQNWARQQRYRIFRDLKQEYQADAILTAHHRDDQIETILQKLFRGSSPSAWQGMKVWDGELFRPLLDFSKAEILNLCDDEAIPSRTDKSNLKPDFSRNFIRQELSEKLHHFFPGWDEHILNLQEKGETYESAINLIADSMYKDGEMNLNQFRELPENLKSAVLKQIIDKSGYSISYSKRQLEELKNVEHLQTGKSLFISPLKFTRDREKIRISTEDVNDKFTQAQISEEELNPHKIVSGIRFSLQQNKNAADLVLDAENLSWPLLLRRWTSGDSFVPLGMKGRQKIKDHLTNRKISAQLKEKALVLCGSDGTIYALIYPETAGNMEKGAIAELAKTGKSTTKYLTIAINLDE